MTKSDSKQKLNHRAFSEEVGMPVFEVFGQV